jgi:hypothetical protein
MKKADSGNHCRLPQFRINYSCLSYSIGCSHCFSISWTLKLGWQRTIIIGYYSLELITSVGSIVHDLGSCFCISGNVRIGRGRLTMTITVGNHSLELITVVHTIVHSLVICSCTCRNVRLRYKQLTLTITVGYHTSELITVVCSIV